MREEQADEAGGVGDDLVVVGRCWADHRVDRGMVWACQSVVDGLGRGRMDEADYWTGYPFGAAPLVNSRGSTRLASYLV